VKISDIARVDVNWMEGCRNDPGLRFVLKRDRELTPSSEFRYKQSGNIFYAVHESEVRFVAHNRNDHNGFGFARFDLHMHDDWDASQWKPCQQLDGKPLVQRDFGSMSYREVSCTLEGRILHLTGPWSSGASVVSKIIGPVVDVSVLTGPNRETIRNPKWYHRNKRRNRAYEGMHYAANLTLEFVQEAIDVHAPHLEMYEGDFGWYPVRKGDQPKNPRKGIQRPADLMLDDTQAMVVCL
jgi:hypothetical protein